MVPAVRVVDVQLRLSLPERAAGKNDAGVGDHDNNEEDEDAPAGIPLDIPLNSLSNSSSGSRAFGVLDASMVDVYKQCQCAIFLVNPYSSNALNYMRRELPQVCLPS